MCGCVYGCVGVCKSTDRQRERSVGTCAGKLKGTVLHLGTHNGAELSAQDPLVSESHLGAMRGGVGQEWGGMGQEWGGGQAGGGRGEGAGGGWR